MYARDVERSAARLQELQREEWADLVLAIVVFGLALVSAEVDGPLAVPLLLGGMFAALRTMRAAWLHWDLLDRLALERDAHTIPGVRALAARAGTMDNRRRLAAAIRRTLEEPAAGTRVRITENSADLLALAADLERSELEIDPICAVACERLVTVGEQSPLLSSSVRADDLRVQMRRIRAGFRPRPSA